MYRTCAFHGCDVAFNRCEIHHIEYFELGGLTDLANLLPLCVRHHHLVHDLAWTLRLDEQRTLTIIDHHGQIHAVVPLPARTPPIVPNPIDRTDDAGPPPDPPRGRPPDQLSLIA
jgi:hypothetical protein